MGWGDEARVPDIHCPSLTLIPNDPSRETLAAAAIRHTRPRPIHPLASKWPSSFHGPGEPAHPAFEAPPPTPARRAAPGGGG